MCVTLPLLSLAQDVIWKTDIITVALEESGAHYVEEI